MYNLSSIFDLKNKNSRLLEENCEFLKKIIQLKDNIEEKDREIYELKLQIIGLKNIIEQKDRDLEFHILNLENEYKTLSEYTFIEKNK
jgi:hypothetical protein